MASDSERLARIERRIEALLQAVAGDEGLHATVRITNAMLANLMEWLQKPPSNELSDTLRQLVVEVAEVREGMAALPEKVAKAVLNGEV